MHTQLHLQEEKLNNLLKSLYKSFNLKKKRTTFRGELVKILICSFAVNMRIVVSLLESTGCTFEETKFNQLSLQPENGYMR